MKRIFTVSFLLFTVAIFVYSQEQPKAKLVNQFSDKCSEIISKNYDYFLIELQKSPNSKGYIIFNGENSNEGTNLNYANHFANYPTLRGMDLSRIVFIRGKNLNKMNVEFWIVPDGSEFPKVKSNFQPILINKTTRYQKTYTEFSDLIDSDKSFVNSFYTFEGCDFAPNFQEFTKVLLKDENLIGYLIIYSSDKQSKKIKKIALKELQKTYKVPKNRLKTIYGGIRKESEIELWFVPKGDKSPTISTKNE